MGPRVEPRWRCPTRIGRCGRVLQALGVVYLPANGPQVFGRPPYAIGRLIGKVP